ncbi:MAG: amidophosphoribosyltransferase [Deltaproteobacteria bacterium]|nr:amidophosphoribosyltransferase [Deltaproteobacteria bacterium]
MDGLKEECGIVAVYQMGKDHTSVNVAPIVVRALVDLQNRGQLSAGMTSYNPARGRILQTHKELGTVHEVFRLSNPFKSRRLLNEYSGGAAIGHTRYATSGATDLDLAQPFERVHGRMWKWFAIGFNGNLANYDQLKEELEDSGYHITYNSDTEVMMHFINRELRGETPPDFSSVFKNLSTVFDGAYNLTFINAVGEMVVIRDPLGIKPLCYGVKDDLFVAASESNVLLHLGMDPLPLDPGELLIVTRDGFRKERFHPPVKKAHCFFEWVYFANLASNLEGRSVYQARHDIGRELAAVEPLAEKEGFVVISIPETAATVGNSFGFHLGLPVMSGLLRNRYVGRTFIDGVSRADSIRMKFTPIPEVLEGQKIFLVDDTLVRATTLKTVIEELRLRGRVKEIHVRIGCPPIMGPCFYGIDMPTLGELFSPKFLNGTPMDTLPPPLLKKMAAELGADSLNFLPMPNLIKALGLPEENLCRACLDGKYPTPEGQRRYLLAMDESGLKKTKD